MAVSQNQAIFQNSYELSPILLTNGIATGVPGNYLPIIQITEGLQLVNGLLAGPFPTDPDDFFAHFRPAQGSTLISNDISKYPFANQAIAANAIITQPLTISLIMDCPANQPGGYVAKLAQVTALQQALQSHINLGGTFTVATPSYIYTNCILLNLRDVSRPDSKQVQNAYQWDFIQPLLTQQQAQQAYNNLMGKIAGGLPNSSTAWSNTSNTVGSSPGGTPPTLAGSGQLTGAAVTGTAQTQSQVTPGS